MKENSFKRALNTDSIQNEDIKNIELYNFDINFKNNFKQSKEDKHIVIRISIKDNNIDLLLDKSSICLSNPKKLLSISELEYLIWDYDTIFGTRYNIFKLYDKDFFDCQERVLFEALIIKFKKNKFQTFKWAKTKIGMELGIKRNKRDRTIKRFKELGIIKTVTVKSIPNNGLPKQSCFFTLDSIKIIELLPKIFSSFEYFKVKNDIISYLKPDLEDEKLSVL